MFKKRVTIRSTPEGLEFELDVKFVQKESVVTAVAEGKDVKIDTELPSKLVTKLCVLIRTTNFAQMVLRPIDEGTNPLESLQTNQRNFVELICQNQDHIRNVIELHEALEVKDMGPFIGFLAAYFLRGKTEEEVASFFALADKSSEEQRRVYGELCARIPDI